MMEDGIPHVSVLEPILINWFINLDYRGSVTNQNVWNHSRQFNDAIHSVSSNCEKDKFHAKNDFLKMIENKTANFVIEIYGTFMFETLRIVLAI